MIWPGRPLPMTCIIARLQHVTWMNLTVIRSKWPIPYNASCAARYWLDLYDFITYEMTRKEPSKVLFFSGTTCDNLNQDTSNLTQFRRRHADCELEFAPDMAHATFNSHNFAKPWNELSPSLPLLSPYLLLLPLPLPSPIPSPLPSLLLSLPHPPTPLPSRKKWWRGNIYFLSFHKPKCARSIKFYVNMLS